MKKLIIILILFSFNVAAKNIETWKCSERYDSSKKTLVKATVKKGRTEGTINVAGVSHNALFEVAGFNRRWDFGLTEKSTYNYAFIIKPNGDASYYDFSMKKNTKPSMRMECRKSK